MILKKIESVTTFHEDSIRFELDLKIVFYTHEHICFESFYVYYGFKGNTVPHENIVSDWPNCDRLSP